MMPFIKFKCQNKIVWYEFQKFRYHTLQAVFITANSAVETGTTKRSLVFKMLLATSAKKLHMR